MTHLWIYKCHQNNFDKIGLKKIQEKDILCDNKNWKKLNKL